MHVDTRVHDEPGLNGLLVLQIEEVRTFYRNRRSERPGVYEWFADRWRNAHANLQSTVRAVRARAATLKAKLVPG